MSIFVACEDFLDPNQELVLRESDIPGDEVELRSISLGLYALQQDLVEQIVILGELRGDLVEITDNADPDLVEVNNFQISQGNRYISPVNFYKLIAASNKMIRILKNKFPEVLDKESAISNHHKMYGEAICMRSWAYFNAVRIYNEIPYIPETLTDISEIDQFVNSSGTYIDSTFIDYHQNGFDNDTTIKVYEYTERRFLDQDAITKLCINDIEEGIRDGGVGVDYSFDNYDETWNVTIWGEYSMNALLGQMYLHIGDYVKAMKNFNVFLAYGDSHGGAHRFGLDDLFSNDRWGNIFTSINENEHIFTVWFGKSSLSFQRNSLQSYFSAKAPNLYALKPTRKAVELWETVWKGKDVSLNSQNPNSSRLIEPGVPGDFSRGNGVSYAYIKNGDQLDDSEVAKMLELKYLDNQNELTEFMEGVDTVVYKYTLGKSNPFAHDAYFMIYRAAGIHLYAAEIYANWKAFHGGSLPVEFLNKAEMYIYDGKYRNDPRQLGVAGRVGLGDKEGITVGEHIIYDFHPYNNEIIGYKTIATKLEKQRYLEEIVLDERARELAFEGERFYDIVRIARRRNKVGLDGSGFLATIISEKFPASEREQIKNLLQNPDNWYLPFTLR
jgi:hypothetical protein